jgi:hypothetical protein
MSGYPALCVVYIMFHHTKVLRTKTVNVQYANLPYSKRSSFHESLVFNPAIQLSANNLERKVISILILHVLSHPQNGRASACQQSFT